MNKSIKIALLCLAVLITLGAVMFFYKTKVAPPSAPETADQFKKALAKDIEVAENAASERSADSIYRVIIEATAFMRKDSLLSAADNDETLVLLTDKYVPKFVTQSHAKFARSSWSEADLNFMRSRIAELISLKKSGGTAVLSNNARTKLGEITGVLDLYNRAKAAASVGGYSSLADARSKIAAARQFVGQSPISNNTALVQKLNGVASTLERSHFASVSAAVEKMKNYSSFRTEEAFDAYARKVSNLIDEYKNNANSVYGHAQSVGGLLSKYNDYYNNAYFYDSGDDYGDGDDYYY